MSLCYFLHTELIPWVDVSSPERTAVLEQLMEENHVNDWTFHLTQAQVDAVLAAQQAWRDLRDQHAEVGRIKPKVAREAALAALPPLGEFPEEPEDPDAIDQDDSDGNESLHEFIGAYMSATEACGDGVYYGHVRDTSATAVIHHGIMHFAAQCCENTDDIEDAIPEIGDVVNALDRMDSNGWDTGKTGILSCLWDWYCQDCPGVPFPQGATDKAATEDDED